MVDSGSLSETDSPGGLTCLLFRVAGEGYALPLLRVASVQVVSRITRVPGTTPLIHGIMDLRGTLLPVLNLARVLGLSESHERGGHVIVVRSGGQELGVLVDEAQDILAIDPAAIEPRLSTLSGERAELIEGQVQTRSGLVGLLKLDGVIEAVRRG